MTWMFIISFLLFWLPVIGPLIAGIVGGKKAGGVGPAILAVLLPIVVLGVALTLFGSALTGIPLLGAVLGLGAFVILLTHVGPLLLGAIIGGLIAS
ncbi:MAG TPA: hypothetical protein VJT33_00225 [bacterium]|nr:hypothetical protein [bacterium]